MRIRFLQVVDSDAPGVPFLAGQTIEVVCPTPAMLNWIESHRAEVVRDESSEVITDAIPDPEMAVVPNRRNRRMRRA